MSDSHHDDPPPEDPRAEPELEDAVRAVEQRFTADHNGDAEETVVLHDGREVPADEEPAP